ncbi:MAG TPA: amino acid adenylation domain-containing protein [Pyrinomonadaceae bacterium]|nr:amino acid adenylation domain-containing protein [Pyrinomonadaceae bacterium]
MSAELTAALREVSRREGVTVFMLLVAAYQLLLSRYSGQGEVTVGTAIANRNWLETEGLVGFFVNQLVLRGRLGECETGRELLGQVRETVLSAYAHQDVPFERVVEEVSAERDLSRSPLFQAMFLYERREARAVGLTDVVDTAQEVEHQWAKFDLTLMAEDTAAGLGLRLEYATDLFSRTTAERFAKSLQLILAALAARPEQALARLPIMDAPDAALISDYWNMTARPYESRLVHELFEAQAARTPDAVAVTCGAESLSYAELNRRADALAARLSAHGAGPERRVAVCVERGFDLLVALLGVLKSGSAYVPLDPEYPRERVSYVLEDSGASVLVTQPHLLATLPQTKAALVYVDATEEQEDVAKGDARARVRCVPANTAYVIYTSGSTGRPKGVAVSHDNVANFFAGMDDAIADGACGGKWLAVTTVSFDISVLELFWTLARGFEVVFPAWVESAARVSAETNASKNETSATKTTDFSLFYFAAEDGAGGNAYKLLLEGARFADEHGFSAVWTPERHFHSFGGIYPNPALTSAAVAAVTRNIRIRSGSVVLPLRHPVAVAEDWAVVDNLSGGRAGVSFASGWHAADFVLAPEAYTDRKALMLRNIELVRALWRGETIRLPGGAGKEVDVRIHPRPVQKEIPVWLTAAGNPETFRTAGQIGANLLTHLLGQTVEELAANVRLYREARKESGREGTGHVTLMVHTFVAPDVETIREQVRAPFTEYLRQSLDLVRAFGRAIGLDVDAVEFTAEDMEALLGHAADRYMDAASLIGTPEKCLEMVAQLKAAGVDEIACLIDFGVEFEATMESLRLLDTVRLAANRPASHTESIPKVIREQGVTHLQCTPSLARVMLAEATAGDLDSLRGLFLGGEALPGALVSELRELCDAPIFNMYGPTETTIWSAVKPVGNANGSTVAIANPIANTQLYVLDTEGMLCPIGVAGELYIGGAGVAHGYAGRPRLTAERFVPDVFGTQAGARLYRTGDVVRRREDGELEFLGRRDGQVKLRGYRIELGEVEAVLSAHTTVRAAAVTVREIAGAQTLVAYFAGEADPAELREHAGQQLPSYMIPQRFVRLDALPLTANGKLDRRALPAPDEVEATQASANYNPPRTPTEEIICNVWAEVLGRERVGVDEDFFTLGGHSLLATQVVSRVRSVFGVEVALRVLFETPTAEALAAEVERLRDAGNGAGAPPPLVRADRSKRLPLSFAQQRLWFIDQLEPGNPAYNSPRVVRLEGELDHAALVAALSEIVRRHEVLRTSFPTVGGKPVQRIGAAREMAVPVVDVEFLGAAAGERAARELAEREASRPFNLATGPMLRTLLVRLNERAHVLVLVLHHVVSDAWSTGVLVREFGMLYEAFRHGEGSPLAELKVQYADYAVWQRGWLRGEVLDSQLAYWRTQLEGLQPLQLLTDRPRSSAAGNRAARWHSFRWPAETAQKLNNFSRREGVSLYMTLLAGFQSLLASYTGQRDIAVGTDVANRTLLETEGLIGFFINQLVLRTRIVPGMTFREMLRSVRETTLEGYAHQELPFEKLVEELAPERHLDRSPLFQVKLILQNAPESELTLGEVNLSQVAIQQPEGRFELVLSIVESPSGIAGNVEFAAGLYDEPTIARMMEHLRLLLENVSDDPDTLVSGLQMIDAQETARLIEFGAGDSDAVDTDWRGVHELFAAQVARTPHAVAILDKGSPYLYLEVETRANRLANYLRRIGVGADVRVALLLERGFDLAVATLAVLKAGGAYVPINRAWPEERIAQVIDDAAIPVVIVHEALREQLPTTWGRVISIDADWPDVAAEDAERPQVETHPEMAAYVIYTSGSTGKPKGVVVSHAALASRIETLAEMYELREEDRVLQFVSPAFDPFGLEFYPSLTRGAAVAFEPGVTEMSGLEIARLARERGITVSLLLPAKLEEVTAAVAAMPQDARPSLRLLLSGGEAVSAAGVTAWQETFGVPTLHQYGPTEATILASAYARAAWMAHDQDPTALMLGRPIRDAQLYVLGEEGQLCPIGVPGELYIGGAGVARGYLNRPELTAEKFIPDSFSTKPGARLYRTGDVARWRADGQLEFLGRRDEQVKLRGYRIELGEVEATLAGHGGVRGCAVMLRDVACTPALVAYVTGEADGGELREYLAKQLPSYMVPQRIVKVEALPLTANGKVDRKALPDPDVQETNAAGNYNPPRTQTEEIVCGIWADVLGLGRVGTGENFFELGGHSLLVTQVVARVRAVFGVEIPLRVLFETPLVEAVAAEVERQVKARGASAAAPQLTRADRSKPLPLSFAQQRLWFIDQLEPANAAYNVPLAVRLGGRLDVGALAASLTEIVRRHEVLRTSFPTVDGEPVQLIHEAQALPVPVVDLSDFDADLREQAARQLADEEAARPFDLADASMLVRALLIKLGAESHVLVVVLHHIAADGWSADVLMREFGALYEAFSHGRPSPLSELTIQYADYALWQREWLRGEVLEAQLRYWRGQLAGLERLELPFVKSSATPSVRRKGAAVQFTVPAEVASALRKLSRDESATVYMTLLAAFQVLLFRYSGQRDIALGTPTAGRDLVESESLVGFFVNVLIIRTRLSPDVSFRELVRQVRDASVAAYAHGQIPFELVVSNVAGERQLGEDALFQATFDFAAASSRGKRLADTDAEFFELADLPVKRDLNLVFAESGECLVGSLQYDAAKTTETDARALTDNLSRLLTAVAEDAHQPVIDIPLGSPDAATPDAAPAGFDESELEPDFAF